MTQLWTNYTDKCLHGDVETASKIYNCLRLNPFNELEYIFSLSIDGVSEVMKNIVNHNEEYCEKYQKSSITVIRMAIANETENEEILDRLVEDVMPDVRRNVLYRNITKYLRILSNDECKDIRDNSIASLFYKRQVPTAKLDEWVYDESENVRWLVANFTNKKEHFDILSNDLDKDVRNKAIERKKELKEQKIKRKHSRGL